MAGGEERSNTMVVVSVYDAILGINPCKWFQEALKATLKCLGFAELPAAAVADDDDNDHLQHPLTIDDSNDHKDVKLEEPSTVLSRGSSSSSSSREDGDYQEQGDVQPSTTNPSSPHPSSSSDPSSLLVLESSRMPPRPPVSSGRGGQTN